MGEVIVITSGKGGVGKTTSVANIGTGIALNGKKVLLLDADIGLRNLDLVLGLENRIVFDLVDVVEERCKLRNALVKDKRFDGLFLLPAAQTRDKTAVKPEQMIKLCDQLRLEFDYILIDCPAGIESGFNNAVVAADKAIVVTTPEVSAVRDADRVIGLLESKDLRDPKLIINRIKADMVKKGEMLSIEDVSGILAVELAGIIPDDDKIVVSTNRGDPVITCQKSLAGQAYRNIAKRILGEDVPLLDLENDEGLLEKIKKFLRLKTM